MKLLLLGSATCTWPLMLPRSRHGLRATGGDFSGFLGSGFLGLHIDGSVNTLADFKAF